MPNIHKLDFILDKFHQPFSAITENYTTITMGEYVTADNEQPKHFVLTRHDVDGRAETALDTAHIEKELGRQATYYFNSGKKVLQGARK